MSGGRGWTWGLVAGVSAVLASVDLVYPFGRDQGNYAYAAWAWLDGAALYRDVYVFKPPATVWVHALAQGLFGHSMTAIRVLDLLWTVATALAVTDVLGRLGEKPRTAVAGGLLYSFVYVQQTWWTTAQTDGWMALPAALAIGVAARAPEARRPSRVLFGAGLLLGTAIPFKYTAAAALLPLLLLLRPLSGWGARLRGAAAIGAGMAVPVLASGAWLVGTGAWAAFRETQSAVVSGYVATTRHFGVFDGTWHVATKLITHPALRWTTPWFGIGLVVLAVTWRRPRSAVLAAWFLAGLVSCVSQGKLFMYHYLYFFPPLGAVAGLGLTTVADAVLARLPGRVPRVVAVGALVYGMVMLSRLPGQAQRAYRVAVGGRALVEEWRRGPYHQPSFSMADDLALAEHLRATTAPGDRVFLWGFEPLVNFVAERKTVSRFLYNYPFAVPWKDPAYDDELLAALEADPPAAFVVASHDATPGVTGTKDDSRALFAKFDRLRAFVAARYGAPAPVKRFDVYTRRPDPHAP